MLAKYLLDRNFLKRLDIENKKELFIRISVLDFVTEDTIAFIEGKSTSGNCNLSGTSNMRRTASVSLVVDPYGVKKVKANSYYTEYGNITEAENLISLNKKVKLSVGIKNSLAILGYYPEENIIWFPLGMYVIKNASVSKGTGGANISLTLNDKCALLNGEMGGTFPAGINLSEVIEYSEDGKTSSVKKIPLKDIIRNIVVEYGGERADNIIISDIDDYVLKVMKWNGNNSIYLIEGTNKRLSLTEVSDSTEYTKNRNIGYTTTPFVYPGNLTMNAGEAAAAALDKIKNILGNFEWFYDIDGRFVFQENKNYLNHTPTVEDAINISEYDYLSFANSLTSIYTFDNSNRHLITNISNAPQYNNIKNDFVVWGSRKGTSGAKLPIRYHLAFDTKPMVDISNQRFALVTTDARGLQKITPLILNKTYVMETAQDVEKKMYVVINKVIYKYDKTHPEGYKQVPGELCYLITDDWRTEYYYRGLWEQTTFAKNPYAAELNAEWPKIWNAKKDNRGSSADGYPVYKGGYKDNLTIYDYDYWLDFIEGAYEGTVNLSQFNVNKIGRRTKIVTQKDVNCLFSEDIPPYIYINADGDVSDERKQAEQIGNMEAIQVKPEIYQCLSVGGGQVSAFNTIKDLLVTHTQYANNVNLTTIPIYHLEPNTRITIEDEEIGVKGDYLIKSISLPLTVNGTSSISATKCIEKMI